MTTIEVNISRESFKIVIHSHFHESICFQFDKKQVTFLDVQYYRAINIIAFWKGSSIIVYNIIKK